METYIRQKIKNTLINSSISGLLTGLFMFWFYFSQYISLITGFAIGFFIYLGIFFYKDRIEKKYLRKTPFILTFLLNTIIQCLIILIIVILFVGIFYIEGKFYLYFSRPAILTSSGYIFGFIFGILLSMCFSFILLISNLVGKNVLRNLFIGKYRNPSEEEYIFLFLDIAFSTSIAEKIGHQSFLSLLNDFFYDIVEPVSKTRGDIYKYVGDEVIITWPIKHGIYQSNCLQCIKEINELLKQKAEAYQNKYGIVPAFKAGLHGGTVAIGEIGFTKKEIGFVGDVVNTTSRIAIECKNHPYLLLISEDLLMLLPQYGDMDFKQVGYVRLKRKEKEMKLFGWEV